MIMDEHGANRQTGCGSKGVSAISRAFAAPIGCWPNLSRWTAPPVLICCCAPSRLVPALLRRRYLALMVLFDLPGNSMPGGGIALAAGMSGLFSFPLFVGTVLIAIAPAPLFFYLTT